MSGLFGGDDTPAQPTRSPKGVKIVKTASGPGDTILGMGSRAHAAGSPGLSGTRLLDDEDTMTKRYAGG